MLFAVGCSKEEEVLPDGDIPGKVYDIDGNKYRTIKIGYQIWMAENLRVTRYRNGDAISTGLSRTEWQNTTGGAYAIYDHNHNSADGINSPGEMVAAYGKLYNWYVTSDPRGLCPAGWSVASDDDWTQLVDYVATQGFPNENIIGGAGNALKSCRQVGSPLGGDCDTSEHPRWGPNDPHWGYGFDEFGFSALPGGDRRTNGSFYGLGSFGLWWSATEFSDTDAWGRIMFSDGGLVFRYGPYKRGGFSVRCVRDFDPTERTLTPASEGVE